MNPDDRRYSKEHEWAKLEGEGRARVGITAHAVEELGDVVYFDFPEVGTQLDQSQKFGEVESVKAVSDLYTPLGGEVVEVNQVLVDTPETVNEDPWEKGWLIVLRLRDEQEMDTLLSAQEYTDLTSGA